MNLPIQESLHGKYEILEKIGEGGIGSVYKVRHRLLEEIRVIKVLRAHVAGNDDLQERFLHEARMAIRLKHPKIAHLHDFSITAEGTAYIVMEFIDGVALDDLLRVSGAPSLDLALEIGQQALGALSYLHSENFVHRDISPDNLMLSSGYDSSPVAKLIDLGIAKNLEGDSNLTATGMFLGKVRYSSPEQFSTSGGGEDLDRRSDLYSFGVLLYELLTGSHPFAGKTFSQVASCHLFEPPRSFAESDPQGQIPSELRQIVLKALEKEPEKRFSTAEDFAERLAPFRNPDRSLRQELRQSLETTAAALAKRQASEEAGSTQIRLDRDFGMVSTPSPEALSPDPDEDATLLIAEATKLLAEGNGEKAPTRFAWKRWGLAASLILAMAAAFWFLKDRIGASVEDGELAEQVQVEPTERFELENAGIASDVEPPPFTAAAATKPSDVPEPSAEDGVAADNEENETEVGSEQPDDAEEALLGIDEAGATAEPAPGTEEASPTTVEIYQSGVGVVPPVLLELPPAIHPDSKKLKRELVLTVNVLVDETGAVMNPTIKSGPTFKKKVREAALEAVRGAKFQPASKDGVNGRMWTEVRVVFSPGQEPP